MYTYIYIHKPYGLQCLMHHTPTAKGYGYIMDILLSSILSGSTRKYYSKGDLTARSPAIVQRAIPQGKCTLLMVFKNTIYSVHLHTKCTL